MFAWLTGDIGLVLLKISLAFAKLRLPCLTEARFRFFQGSVPEKRTGKRWLLTETNGGIWDRPLPSCETV